MPVQLATITLTASSTSGSISLAAMQVSALPRSSSGPYAHLELVNESASGLVFTFPNTTNEQWPIPAGKHRIIPIPPGESIASWTVLNQYPSPYIQQCFVFYFEFNEQPVDLGQVGGAQIGYQPRVIALGPTAIDNHFFANMTSLGDQNFPQGYNLTAATIANGSVIIYLYWISITMFASVTAASDLSLFVDIRNSVPAILSSTEIYRTEASVAVANTSQQYGLTISASPKAKAISLPGGSTNLVFRLHNNTANTPVIYADLGAAPGANLNVPPGSHDTWIASAGPW